MDTIWRRRLIRTTALVGILLAGPLAATPALAQARTYTFNIPAKPLGDALKDFGRTTGTQLLFSEALVAGRMAPRITGTHSTEDALGELLAGAGLTWKASSGGAIMIVAKEPIRPQEVGLDHADNLLAEVMVVGSRLSRPADGPAPVTVFDRKAIEQLGVSNLADVLNYLPQQTFSLNESQSLSGQRVVRLRGLATGTTLILVNGRRVTPNAGSITTGAFDLNSIPLAAVERVEVLSDSASGVYGADAVGGVVNIVLKSHLSAPVIDASYGSADGGAAERRVSLSVGGETERARGLVVLDYFKRDALMGSERDELNNADYRRFGGVDRRSLTANPGNICSASGLALPGLATPCATVPSGVLSPTLADFAATAGQQNLESRNRFVAAVPESRRYGGLATGSYDLAPHLNVFGELMYADDQDIQVNGPRLVSNALAPANNPFNPFGVAVRANYLLTAAPTNLSLSQEISYREVIGARGALGRWDWEVSAVGAQSTRSYQTFGNIDATRLAAAIAATTPALALNLFANGPGGSAALLTSLVADPSTNRSDSRSDVFQVGGFARGVLMQLPAGPLQAVLGAEWRKESVAYASPTTVVRDGLARRESASAYSELRVPILGGALKSPLGAFDLTLAGRYDHYSDFGGTFNAQYGAEWRPTARLLFRASYGDSFRAPPTYQLFQPQTVLAGVPTPDPRRNGELASVTIIGGGNPNLKPETSTSQSYGVVWTPDVPGRPRLAATYWDIRQDQRIVIGFSSATLLANETILPARVVRAAPTAADLAAGLTGRLLSLDTSRLNLGSLETSGVDVEASAVWDSPVGRLAPSLTATQVLTYKAADFPTSPVTSRVGRANLDGSVPRWKVVGTLAWSRGPYGVTLAGRYNAGYQDASLGVLTTRRVKATTIFDLQGSVDLGDALGGKISVAQGLVLRLGAINLLDRRPSYSDIYGMGYDPTQGDVRQRYIYAAISKRF